MTTSVDSSELSAVIGALLDELAETNNDEVKRSVNDALKKISHHNPETLISAGIYYFELHRKISSDHAADILKVMIDTLRDELNELNNDLAKSVTELAINKLDNESNAVDDSADVYEKECSELLVALSRLHCYQTMDSLLNKFKPNAIPKCSIIRTMGLVACCNPFGIVPFIKLTMSIIFPLLSQQQINDKHKQAFCFIIAKFGEAINDYIMNLEEAPDTKINKSTFYDEMSSAFDVLVNSWLKTGGKNLEMAESIVLAVCSIIPLLPKQNNEARISKLMPILVHMCKYPPIRLTAVKCISIFLDGIKSDEEKAALRPFIDQIQMVLFDFICITPFEVFRDALLTHYEILQCYKNLVVLFPEEGLDRILLYLKSTANLCRTRGLIIIRHLINTLPSEDDTSLQRIALSIQNIIGDGGNNSPRQMAGVIVALAAHPTITLLPSQRTSFIHFIVMRSVTADDETQSYEEALFLLATTVDGIENWLWPSLLKTLLDQNYRRSAVSILRALSALAVKIIRNDNSSSLCKEFSGTKILARCLELMDVEKNRLAAVTFLRSSAPLLGHQLKPEWDVKLLEMSKFLEESSPSKNPVDRALTWEEQMVEFIEKSVELEGKDWNSKLLKELVAITVPGSLNSEEKILSPVVAPYVAAIAGENEEQLTMLVHLSRTQPFVQEYPRAVGIAAKHAFEKVVQLLEAACNVEDMRKNPTKLLGLVKDTKAAASAEASKANLFRCYGEICKRGDAKKLFPHIEKHILPWIVKQLNDCKEITSKEAGLFAIEQIGAAVHPNRLINSNGLKARGHCLNTLLALLQSHSGYKPIQLYPALLVAIISLLKIPPKLTPEERQALLSTIIDKIIIASTEIDIILNSSNNVKNVISNLGIICVEIIGDCSDTLAELVDILLPWMQSKNSLQKKNVLIILCTSLKAYCESLKYTYPGGKLEPGKLLGRILCWSADPERPLRSPVVNAIALALEIEARHRSTVSDNNLKEDLSQSKKLLLANNDEESLYNGVKLLSTVVCERIVNNQVSSLAEGLIEGLVYNNESGISAAIALKQLFQIRGADIPRSNLYFIDNIVNQMRQIDNANCRSITASAIKSLIIHHPEEVIEHLLHQPLPLDLGTKECWKEIGNDEESGLKTLEFLINRLENNPVLSESMPSLSSSTNSLNQENSGNASTASLPAMAAVIALKYLLQSQKSDKLVLKYLSELLTILLKCLAGWIHADAPVSVVTTKFGFVPNREARKLNPHREVFSILRNILTVVNPNLVFTDNLFDVDQSYDNLLVSTVSIVYCCLLNSHSNFNNSEILINIAQSLGKLVSSTIPTQRAIAIAFYSELIGKIDCGVIWMEAIMNILHDARLDSSFLVRKLAIIGLTKIAYLDSKYINEYFYNCIIALLDSLEESPNGNEVILESLKGLSTLLALKTDEPVSPRVVLQLKPFVDKDNWEMKLAAITALGSISRGWLKTMRGPNDDATDHLLGCLPCLVLKLEDPNPRVVKAAKDTLFHAAQLFQCESLTKVVQSHLKLGDVEMNFEGFCKDLIHCLVDNLPDRAEEMRNAVGRGYSRSEMPSTRATSVLILGFFGPPRPDDIQRMLQLLRDKDTIVKIRAAKAISLGFTLS